MKITGLDEIAEEGLTLDTGFKLYNRAKTAYIEADTQGFNVVGTQTVLETYNALADASVTLTAAQHRGGLISVATGANNRTLTTLTAAQLVAAFPGVAVGSSATLQIINLKAANTVTMSPGSGVTTVGDPVVAAATAATFKTLFTNVTSGAEAVQLLRVA